MNTIPPGKRKVPNVTGDASSAVALVFDASRAKDPFNTFIEHVMHVAPKIGVGWHSGGGILVPVEYSVSVDASKITLQELRRLPQKVKDNYGEFPVVVEFCSCEETAAKGKVVEPVALWEIGTAEVFLLPPKMNKIPHRSKLQPVPLEEFLANPRV